MLGKLSEMAFADGAGLNLSLLVRHSLVFCLEVKSLIALWKTKCSTGFGFYSAIFQKNMKQKFVKNFLSFTNLVFFSVFLELLMVLAVHFSVHNFPIVFILLPLIALDALLAILVLLYYRYKASVASKQRAYIMQQRVLVTKG